MSLLAEVHGLKSLDPQFTSPPAVSETTRECVVRPEFGLSLHVQLESGVCFLYDFGQSGHTLLNNASALGIDLKKVDFCVLSNPHFDHGGGIPAFCEVNSDAPIFVHSNAFCSDQDLSSDCECSPREFLVEDQDGDFVDIGVSRGFLDNFDRFALLDEMDGMAEFCDDVFAFTHVDQMYPLPIGSLEMRVREGDEVFVDPLDSELNLVVRQDSGNILLTGCARNGIANILRSVRFRFFGDLDVIRFVVGGIHLMYDDSDYQSVLNSMWGDLTKGQERYFYLNHCTGVSKTLDLQTLMGKDLVSYFPCGQTLELSDPIIEKKKNKLAKKKEKFSSKGSKKENAQVLHFGDDLSSDRHRHHDSTLRVADFGRLLNSD